MTKIAFADKSNGSQLTAADINEIKQVVNTNADAIPYIDTNASLTANSDTVVPSQKAVKAYVDGKTVYFDLSVFYGKNTSEYDEEWLALNPAGSINNPYTINITGGVLEPVNIIGAHNLVEGLANWRNSLSMVGVGLGGVDIVCYGDSILEGYNATDVSFGSAVHIMKVKLQDHFNPDGVIGGYGFIPVIHGGGDNSMVIQFGNLDNSINQSYGVKGLSRGWGAGANGYYVRLNGANAASMRTAADKVQIVGWQFGDFGLQRVDTHIGNGFGPGGIGNGIQSFTHDQKPVNGFHGGVRFGNAVNPSDQSSIPLVAANDNYIQIAGPETGNGIIGAIDGFIAYNGDFNAGVRVHDLSKHGSKITEQLKYIRDAYGESPGNSVTWGTGAIGGGSKNAKLIITNFISNDCGYGPTPETPLATFRSAYGQAMDYLLSLASQPSILVVIPQMSNSVELAARTNVGERWIDFRDAVLEEAAARNLAVFDQFEYFGEAPMGDNENADTPFAKAGYYTDRIHWSGVGQAKAGELYFQMLKS